MTIESSTLASNANGTDIMVDHEYAKEVSIHIYCQHYKIVLGRAINLKLIKWDLILGLGRDF